ncbi:MAG: hypothetical protein J0M20_06040 [Burkholderiales bacterium]|nr:hypothetical protein [Burkholderiales bacterium]
MNLFARHLALAAGLLAAAPSFAALETLVDYDQFVGVDGDIDRNLWGPTYGPVEQIRLINANGQLELGQRVLAKGSTSTGAVANSYGVNFYAPATVKDIVATITVVGAWIANCGANTDTGFTAARIAGSFFNDGGVTANSQLNDVIAQVRMERLSTSTAADGTTDVVARVDKCTSADCSTTTQLFRSVLQAGVPVDTPVRVYMRWDQAAKKFLFKKGTDAYRTYTYTMVDTVAPSVAFKGLQNRTKVENCATSGANRSGGSRALFDNVWVNASADRTPTPP